MPGGTCRSCGSPVRITVRAHVLDAGHEENQVEQVAWNGQPTQDFHIAFPSGAGEAELSVSVLTDQGLSSCARKVFEVRGTKRQKREAPVNQQAPAGAVVGMED